MNRTRLIATAGLAGLLALGSTACSPWDARTASAPKADVSDDPRAQPYDPSDPCDGSDTSPDRCWDTHYGPALWPFRMPDGQCWALYVLEDGIPRVYDDEYPEAVLDWDCASEAF